MSTQRGFHMAKTYDAPKAYRIGSDRIKSALDTFFSGIGQGFNAYLVSKSRINEIERLEAMSDSRLAEMGLKREDIPRYVFRDMLHI